MGHIVMLLPCLQLSREQMLKKLHEKQASLAPRTKRHNRKVMQKLAGELTAEKQLLTKEMIAKTKEALAADEVHPAQHGLRSTAPEALYAAPL